MEDSDFQAALWSDSEIEESSEDKLERRLFSEQVALLIDGLPLESRSTVFGLVGPWGGGKTSLLNLIRTQLECRRDSSPSPSLAIAEFTPWATTDSASLMHEFFSTLLGSHESLRKKGVQESLTSFARKASPLLSAIPFAGAGIAKSVELALNDQNWVQQFSEIDELITAAQTRILIIVDDVDRLHGDEILTLTKTIRLLGRFRNVHYLLAYDHDALIDAIRPSLGGDKTRASAYLEKIVQYPLTIPPAQQVHLEIMVHDGVKGILDSDTDSRERFRVIYKEVLHDRLTTVRSVKRYCSQADLYYSLVRREVNPADFLVMSYLRLFFPEVYNRLPLWKSDLTSILASDATITTWEDRLQGIGLADSNDRVHVINVLRTIFPREFGVTPLHYSNAVSNRYYFDRYFIFGIPSGEVSDEQLLADLQHAIASAPGPFEMEKYRESFTSSSPGIRNFAVGKSLETIRFAPERAHKLLSFILWLMCEQEWRIQDQHGDDQLDRWLGFVLFKWCHLVGSEDYATTLSYLRAAEDSSTTIHCLTRFLSSPLTGSLRRELGDEYVQLINNQRLSEMTTELIAQELFKTVMDRDGRSNALLRRTIIDIEDERMAVLLRDKVQTWLEEDGTRLLDLAAWFVTETYSHSEASGHTGQLKLGALSVERLAVITGDAPLLHVDLGGTVAGPFDLTDTSWGQRSRFAIREIERWRLRHRKD